MLPADAGCIVDNVDTVISIYNAVCKTTPLMQNYYGNGRRDCKSAETTVCGRYQLHKELLEASGGFKTEPGKSDYPAAL